MVASLEGIEATLQALAASVDRRFDAQDRQLDAVVGHLDKLNGRTRETERCIATLDQRVDNLQERTSGRQTVSDVLTGIGIVIAGAVGALFK